MGRLLKGLLYVAGGVVALLVIAAVLAFFFIDSDKIREGLSEGIKEATGRDLVIEGDVGLKVFPSIAIEIGKTTLGNAPGFGEEPFASFDSASLSVRVMPLIFGREISVGTAELESLSVNLAVDQSGRNNWDDLAQRSEQQAPVEEAPAADGRGMTLDISSINVSNTSFVYDNAQTGDRYEIRNANLRSGRVAAGEPVPFEGGLEFSLQPTAISGNVELDLVVTFDTDAGVVTLDDLDIAGTLDGLASVPVTLALAAPRISVNTAEQTAAPGSLRINVLDLAIAADFEPFSYAGSVEPKGKISIDEFSPRALMQTLEIETAPTADPNALTKVSLTANADVGENAIVLRDLVLLLDDTRMTGLMQVPRSTGGKYRLVVKADNIDLNRYMAPADPNAVDEQTGTAPVEIPADLIRPLNATAKLEVAEILLGNIPLQNVEVSLLTNNGKMRVHPITASVFDGSYNGDIRIDVSGNTPKLSFNEGIEGVNLGALAQAMFGAENISGTVNGNFKLAGTGSNTAEMQRTLNGSMSFKLLDGAWEGTDVWYELRAARALFKQEPPPERKLPARTEFSSVTATGTVTDGIFRSDDLLAELPFMRVTGRGTADLPNATVDYGLTARVLEKPEFVTGATEAELDEFTEAVIPLRISGPLGSPSITPDIEEMLKKEIEEKVEEVIFDTLFGGDDEPAEGEEGTKEKDPEDELKDIFKDLIKR